KTRRLGEPARQYMATAVTERFASVMSAAVEAVPASAFTAYAEAFQSQLGQCLSNLDAKVDAELAEVSSSLAAAEAVLAMIERLRSDVDAADGAVKKLVSRFGEATPDELIAEADTEIQTPEDADL